MTIALHSPVKQFSAPVSFYDVESGVLKLVDGPNESKIWEFNIRGRKGFLRMLYEIHGSADQEYVVEWGEVDTLRIKAKTDILPQRSFTQFEFMMIDMLRSVGKSYRLEYGIYNITERPIPSFGTEVQIYENLLGKRSLDHLARALAKECRGYRVVNAAGSRVRMIAHFTSFQMLLPMLVDLDPGIKVMTGNGVVIRARDR